MAQIDLARCAPFRLGSLLVEPALRQVGGAVSETLEPRVMQVLAVLAAAEGRIVSRDSLVDQCWDGRIVGDDSINRVIGRLRKLAADNGASSFRIETVTKVGYRLLCDAPEAVTTAMAPPAAAPRGWSQPDLPPRLATRQIRHVYGRDSEQALLRDAWRDAVDGRGRVVLIGGEPGIGKTFLATELAQTGHAAGTTVLFGHCDEDVPVPYRPFAHAFGHCLNALPDTALRQHAERHQGALTRLLPELRERLAGLASAPLAEANAERFMLFEAAADFVEMVSREAPLVLLLDDLHWASASDLLLLKHLVRTTAKLRLLIVGTFQDRAIVGDHPLATLLADLRREDHVLRLTLGGIDEAGVLALLSGYSGHALDDHDVELARALLRDTAGNPYFIAEMIRQLRESGRLYKVGDRWVYEGAIGDLGLPDGVREVIGKRLQRLPDETNRLLGWAAVIGRDFPLELLEGVVQRAGGDAPGGDAIADAIDGAVVTGLVNELPGQRDRFRFHHALVRATLYDAITPIRRRRMHRTVAETFEAMAAGDAALFVDELAAHWAAGAGAADAAKAVDYASRAGSKAAAGLAFEAAATQFQRAINVLLSTGAADPLLHGDLLLKLADVQRSASDPAFRTTTAAVAAIARARCDATLLGRAALGSSHPAGLQWSITVDPELVALYTEALAALAPDEGPLTIRLMGLLAVELRLGPDRARSRELSAQALALARRGKDSLTLARTLLARAFVTEDPSGLEEQLQSLAELQQLAAELNQLEIGCMAASLSFNAHLAAADLDAAEAALVRSERLAKQLRMPFFAVFAQSKRTLLAVMRGAADAAEQIFALYEAGTQLELAHAAGIRDVQLHELAARKGMLANAIPKIERAMVMTPALLGALVASLCEIGELEKARAVMADFTAGSLNIPTGPFWSDAMMHWAEASRTLENRHVAAVLYDQLLPRAGQLAIFAGIRCDGSLEHAAGLFAACLARWDIAERHFDAALVTNERVGAVVAAVRNRRAYAGMLIERNAPGDRDRAAVLIDAATEAAAALDMPAEAAKLSRLRELLPSPSQPQSPTRRRSAR